MNNKQLNCWVTEDTLEKIRKRAEQNNMKPSAYGSLILNNWCKNSGSQTPIESELEELRLIMKKSGLLKNPDSKPND
ncbi:MAG: hypothetical protein CML12_03735 [Puniceicoccaceae bacterium]|nr:hypothetical protein [Puniceicoccaceae bacterium]